MLLDLSQAQIVDLTHTIHPEIPAWDEGCGFDSKITWDYDPASSKTQFRIQHFQMRAGIGTHMDAPAHCIAGSATIDQINLAQLIAPCFVIDIEQKADEFYQLSVDDVMAFEKQHGLISENALVIVHTGWSSYWGNPKKYRHELSFPSVSEEAAALLLQRNIVGLGIDTLSPDVARSDFPVHRLLLSANKYLLENLANTEKLPATGAYVIVLPMKISGATEAPVRIIAISSTVPF